MQPPSVRGVEVAKASAAAKARVWALGIATRWSLNQGSEYSSKCPKVTKAASSATFHGWKDVDLIVRSNVVEEDDNLNEGFSHYPIVDDE